MSDTQAKPAARPPQRLNSGWRGSVAIGTLLVLAMVLIVANGVAWQIAKLRDAATDWEVHTHQVLGATSTLRLGALSTIRGERGYLLTRDPVFLEPYNAGRAEIAEGLAALKQLVADNPEQSERLALVEGRLDYHLGIMANMIALERSGRYHEAIARIKAGEGQRVIKYILRDLDEFETVERDLLARRTGARQRAAEAAEQFELVLGFAGLALLFGSIWAAFALRSSLQREAAIRRELELSAITDELTGLANRRETLASLDRHMAAARRHKRPLSLAILDIDHFKKVNDAHGHPAGDEVIRRVARLALDIMRDQDVVGRLGGEEFVIVLPDTDAVHALAGCERLRRAIAETTVLLESGQALNITLSAGVAELERGDDRTTLIARADEALYDAKAQGRDRVLLAA